MRGIQKGAARVLVQNFKEMKIEIINLTKMQYRNDKTQRIRLQIERYLFKMAGARKLQGLRLKKR